MIHAKCDLSIELDRPDRRYEPGDRIVGTLRVKVDRNTKCNALTLTRRWRTHGKGNRDTGPDEEDKHVLFRGEWRPGTYTYPIDFACPEEPLTYHGKILNVDWYLDARADVPWALDAKTSTDFFVEPPPQVEAEVQVMAASTVPAAVWIFGSLVMAPVVLVFVVGSLGEGLVNGDIAQLLAGLACCAIVWLLLGDTIKRRIAKRAFRLLAMHVERVGPRRVAVLVDYASSKTLNAVLAKLVVTEVAVRGSGTNSTTFRETIHELQQQVPIGHIEQDRLRVELDLPDPQAVGWSFEVSDNKLTWHLALDFDIENCPNLSEELSLDVRPRVGPAAGP